MHLSDFFHLLFLHQVRYLVCGGVAINLYGIPRSTADLDIILDFEEENLQRFKDCIQQLGFQNSIPVSLLELSDETKRRDLVENKNLVALPFFSTTFQMATLDVLVDFPFDFEMLWKNRTERKPLKGSPLFLVLVEDLEN